MKKITLSLMVFLCTMFIYNGIAQTTSMKSAKASVFTTAKDSDQRFGLTANPAFVAMPQPLETQTCVFIDTTLSFQTLLGIGGAITDASAETFAKLTPEAQNEFLSAYFDAQKGIGYSLLRTNINSCDFSSGSYTYVKDGDKDLSSFNLEHDKQFRIPLIKKALEAAGRPIPLYASPWSPPAYMKSNNNMLRGGKLLPEYYESWALYYTKFVKAYEDEGIPVWGISIQNEPMATQKWESCIYTGEEERDFLKNYLGPIMQREGLCDKNIIAWDHNRDMMLQRASTMLNDPEAAKYVWGIGFHWYETWSGGKPMFENVKLVNQAYPTTNLIFTEGCKENFDFQKLDDWNLGELYGRNMINDFNNGCVAFTDWNILLDEKGGPNHVGNFCFAPIHGDTRSGLLIYTNEYYYIGHFSKYIRPGAKRLACAVSRSSLLATAFRNTDGKTAVVVMNQGDEKVNYFLWVAGNAVEVESPARSIQTIVF